MAESWSSSADGLDWRFRLRPDLRFSDGTPITAALFAALLRRLRDPATGSPNMALFEAITSLTAPDPRTVLLRLKHPVPALPELLAHPAMAALPLHRIARRRDRWTAERPLVTSGAYRLTEWRLNDGIVLTANPRFHGGPPSVTRILWRPIDDRLAALRLFLAGGADTVGDVPATRVAWIAARRPAALRMAPYRGAYYFVINTRTRPFDDRRIRQALTLAIDRARIAGRLMAPGTLPAWGVVPPGIGGLAPYRPAWATWSEPRRLTLARRLLEEVGYGPRRPLVLTIRFNSDADHRRVATALAYGWRAIGVEARLLNSEAAVHFASLRRGDFEVARSGWIGDLSAPENFLGIHRSDAGPVNYSGLDDPGFDALFDRALRSTGPARSGAMRQAEGRLVADAAVLPIAWYTSRNLVGPRVEGWRANLANVHPSRTLRIALPR